MSQKLAIDLGSKQCGFAISDGGNNFALPLSSFSFPKARFDLVILEVKSILAEKDIDLIVLGFPNQTNFLTLTPWQKQILNFKSALEASIKTPVVLVDESYSTLDSQTNLMHHNISKKQRKNLKDELAAVILLERYLALQVKIK